jgi:hypothetical protein
MKWKIKNNMFISDEASVETITAEQQTDIKVSLTW